MMTPIEKLEYEINDIKITISHLIEAKENALAKLFEKEKELKEYEKMLQEYEYAIRTLTKC